MRSIVLLLWASGCILAADTVKPPRPPPEEPARPTGVTEKSSDEHAGPTDSQTANRGSTKKQTTDPSDTARTPNQSVYTLEQRIEKARAVSAAVQDPLSFILSRPELAQALKQLSPRDSRTVANMVWQIQNGQTDLFTPKTFAFLKRLSKDETADTRMSALTERFFPYMIASEDSDFGVDPIDRKRFSAMANAVMRGEAKRITLNEMLTLPDGERCYILTFYPWLVDYRK